MMYFLAIGLGGSFGAVSRYLLSKAISTNNCSSFPWATWTINLTGSFLLGLYVGLQPQLIVHPTWEAMVILGFLSSYTTFATFTYEVFTLIQAGKYKKAATYLISSLGLGLLAALLGLSIFHF